MTGLVEVVSCFGNPEQKHGQSVFYFSDETNSTMGYAISFVLFYNIFSCNCVLFQVRGSLLHRKWTLMASS
jgi:hypothetical protein